MAWHDDDVSLAVWAAIGGAESLGLILDESPGEAIDRCRKRGYGWAETVRDLGIRSTMRQELAEAAAYAGMARWATAARDDAIRACVEGGCPLRVLGDATGMSHTAIVRIRDR